VLVKMAEDMFTTLFGNARPLVINDGYDALQLKYDLRAINPYMLTSGFEKLKKKYRGRYCVVALFVENAIIQIVIGSENAISEIKEPFQMRIC